MLLCQNAKQISGIFMIYTHYKRFSGKWKGFLETFPQKRGISLGFSEKRPIFSVQTVAPQRKRCYNSLCITVDDIGGFLYMTLEECYTAMGANYQDVLKRFYI